MLISCEYNDEEKHNNETCNKSLKNFTKLTEKEFIKNIKNIISKGGNINKPINVLGYDIYSPLITAQINKFNNAVVFLIEHGANVKLPKYDDGLTPLHLAIMYNQTNIARLLISHGSNINAKDKHWEITPLELALNSKNSTIVQLLIDNGVVLRNEMLHTAVLNRDVETVNILLKNHVDVNYQSSGGESALHYAATEGLKDIILLLLKYGADANVKNNFGITPLIKAQMSKNNDIADLLIKNGAKK